VTGSARGERGGDVLGSRRVMRGTGTMDASVKIGERGGGRDSESGGKYSGILYKSARFAPKEESRPLRVRDLGVPVMATTTTGSVRGPQGVPQAVSGVLIWSSLSIGL
jgi:hypothetical protein